MTLYSREELNWHFRAGVTIGFFLGGGVIGLSVFLFL